jgi:hypothetical protein
MDLLRKRWGNKEDGWQGVIYMRMSLRSCGNSSRLTNFMGMLSYFHSSRTCQV